ncbi:DNA damage-inducible transcript 4 protein [Pleurodeles waltl]
MPAHWGTLTGLYWMSSRGKRGSPPPHPTAPLHGTRPSLKQCDSRFSCSMASLESSMESGPESSLETSGYCGSLESSDCEITKAQDYDAESLDNLSLPDPALMGEPELLYDRGEELLCCDLLALIELLLNETQIHALRCSKLMASDRLLAHVGRELLLLSNSEPCGLKGALIDLYVEHGKAVYSVGQLTVDPSVVPTFQLTLILSLEPGLWPRIQSLFTASPAITPGFGQALKLGPGFRVMKKKLYSSDELLDEEDC